ncbi:putative LysM domain protein [Bacillus phage vB_BpuM-BpSp]|nr:putative LysM domain protein [Bacillus phage vB_BpuM-BpSp]
MKSIKLKNLFENVAMYITIIVFALAVTVLFVEFSKGVIAAKQFSGTEKVAVEVESGQTVWDIAKEYKNEKVDYDSMVKEIKSINNLNDNSTINVGEIIYVPKMK